MNRFLSRFGSLLRRPVAPVSPGSLPIEGRMPEFSGIAEWINTGALTKEGLAGKVVLVDFWTYSCVNCVRTLPHLKAWHAAYADKGLVIVGIHTPEFEFEKDRENVRRAVERFGISYPVALDNEYAMWNAFRNHYWPAHYFVDRKGDIRYHHFGEGGYEHSERVLRALLSETGAESAGEGVSSRITEEVVFDKVRSPETYLGWSRMEYLGSPESVRVGAPAAYSVVRRPALNVFYLGGTWEVRDEYAIPRAPGAKIVYRFDASRANLVMDGADGPTTAEILLDGKPLAEDERGGDARIRDGRTVVDVGGGRLYGLVDTRGRYGQRLLEVTFERPGTKVYAFTFG